MDRQAEIAEHCITNLQCVKLAIFNQMSLNKAAKSREQVIERDMEQILYNKNMSCFSVDDPGAKH